MNPWILLFSSPLLAAASPVEPDALAAWGATLWNIVQVAIGLGFVIFVHELGHFMAAKFFGVKCEKFYVGFDVPISIGPIKLPAKLFHFQWGETEYGIGSIPLGGYVKMLGQDDDPRNAEKENERIRLNTTNANGDSSNETEVIGRPQYDPRSFPAKSVFARMVIISAGVVMNVLFGILFAAIAFSIGVPYGPTIIGDVMPGDPAWVAGVQSGDKFVQVAEMQSPNDQLAYRDMVESIALAGFDTPSEPIPISAIRDGKPISFDIVGTRRHDPEGYLLRLGVLMPLTTKLNDRLALKPSLAENWPEAKEVLPALEPGDVIVGVNGTTLPIAEGNDVPMEFELNKLIHPIFDQTVTLQVKRNKKDSFAESDGTVPTEIVDVPWKPLPRRTLGFSFAAGEVTAIQVESQASKAGLQLGDKLVSFDGQPIDDAFALPLQVAKRRGEKVSLGLERGSEKLTLDWIVPESFVLRDGGMQFDPVGVELPGSGMVFAPTAQIANVQSYAEKTTEAANPLDAGLSVGGLKVGDTVVQIRLEAESDEAKATQLEGMLGKESYADLLKGKPLTGGYGPQFVNSLVQVLPIGTKFHIYTKDDKVQDHSLSIANDPNWYQADRGLMNTPLQLKHRVDSIPAALAMGVNEIKKRAYGVVRFVKMAFSWKIPRKAAAGPGMIFYAATSAASEGIADLLMFLTMLSANLAVLNFLPIPALDGGHMMFLIAEAIRGKPVDENLQMRLTVAGVLMLLGLMIFVTFNDVLNLSRLLS
ncbi:MAG: site-2 protease family protein [Planctomycetota bacterium]|nr:site-2 protease family protein [Planctomycetota bacterium]